MFRTLSCLLLSVLGAGCAPVGGGHVRGREAPRLSMQIYVMPAGAQRMETLPLGGTLHRGDRFAVRVEAERPVYVYLAHSPGAGSEQEALAPSQRVVPGTPAHLPGGQAWFTADER